MKALKVLTKNIEIIEIIGSEKKEITSICYDSRKCIPGSMFFALRGSQADGHNFIVTALESGASTIVCEENVIKHDEYPEATVIIVPDSRRALAAASHSWFDDPTKDMMVIGVTGTNGKTTTTFLLKSLLEAAGEECGVIGTTGIYYIDKKITATHTTPESLELCSYFAEMRDSGITAVIMEVSSHALHQHRADFIRFDSAIFTNLTHEHLDYHKTMEEYAAAKKILFNMLPKDAIAIVNDSGEYSHFILEDIKTVRKYSIGRSERCDIIIKDEKLNVSSSEFILEFKATDNNIAEELNLKTRLPGRFNIENSAVSAALVRIMGISGITVKNALSAADGAPGRMQRFLLNNGAVGIVDYAHTPDALEKALSACLEILNVSGNTNNRLLCVFGCGGDRDSSKRPVMGRLATTLADFTIITNDNPRTEDPDKIFMDILAGIDECGKRNLQIVPDRAEAIQRAIELADQNDIILVAGKGHEDYQIIGREKHHFDDVEQLQKFV